MDDTVSTVVMLVGSCVALVYAFAWYVADSNSAEIPADWDDE